MKKKLIFDVAILINAFNSGNIYRTGLFRVTDEVLKGIITSKKYDIFLYDSMNRERILRNHIIKDYPTCNILTFNSRLYRAFCYPIWNLIDSLRKKEQSEMGLCYKGIKNLLLIIAKIGRKLEKVTHKTINLEQFQNDTTYLSTFNSLPTSSEWSRIPKGIIIHDVIVLIKPEYFKGVGGAEFHKQILDSINSEDKVFCVSNATKNDYLKLTQHPEENTFVTLLAAADCFYPRQEKEFVKIEQKFKLQQHNYLLSVCTIEPRKNITTLVQAYNKLLEDNSTIPDLVLSGKYGWEGSELLRLINTINLKYNNKIKLVGYVSDNELAILYSFTNMLIYPSLYEGFGLPPLEAMKCGAPVITSNISSLPEVVGNAAITIDPLNIEMLSSSILKVLSHYNLYSQLSKEQAKSFSWENMTKQIITNL